MENLDEWKYNNYMIDLSNLDDKTMNEQERREYNASLSAVFPRLEKTLKRFMYDQLMHNSLETLTWDEVLAGRGVYCGYEAVLKHIEQAHVAHMERLVPDNFEVNNSLGEL